MLSIVNLIFALHQTITGVGWKMPHASLSSLILDVVRLISLRYEPARL